ncbi:restriction endonuclease subunit S [Pseudoflavonifractor sp. MCC625]|uniref:restriction endonuclease subunit S n=1 Tax=Pseudoflavonifractor sp. MCC625 TaxID=2592647 RepID=UPI001C02596A|nr:restriction endonuclease subunit S [Pseudoflavonifractor sp. MCC625]
MTPAKGFAEMKDSGIDTIGKIPTHWSLCRLRFLCKIMTGNQDTQNAVGDGIYPFYVRSPKIERANSYTFDGESILMAGDGAGAGKVFHHAFGKYAIHQRVYCFYDFNNIVPRYFYYFISNQFSLEIDKGSAKSTVASVRLPMLHNFVLCLPTTKEQTSIATYLDTQCAKIDEIIAQAKSSIEDYRQWKASIIYEAITKGLDQNIELKDSGIEWIGEIPADWAIIRIKNLLTEINDRSGTGLEQPLSMSQSLGVVPSSMIAVANPATSYIGAKIVQPNDLVFNKLKAHLGVFAVSSFRGLVSPDYAVYRANERVDPKFLEYLFKTPNCIQEFKKYITGVGAGLSRLYTNDLFNIKVALPVVSVQRHIVEYLNDFCSQADALIYEKQSLIDDLEAYKNSLIYEVVTGKRRVEDTDQVTIAILSPEILRYRKALLMLRVLDLLGTGVRGRIQLQKCMFAAECLLNMPFHTQFIRYEHGPYDPDLLNIEEIINAKGWYTVLKGSPVSYQKGKQFEEGLREYMDTFSDIDQKLEKIVDFLRPMKTSQAERVATLLAAWNDFIIDGVSHPTDKEIIGEVVTNWTPNKANPQYSTWQDTLYKMREHRFVPKGSGVHTLQKEA